MDKYYARICWNSNGWKYPSGDAAQLENDSYVTKAGFGHEEWLFNFAWLINGYHYGFLQPVYDSIKRVRGKALDLFLYSINPNRQRVYVGEIANCEVLTDAQSKMAGEYYDKAGWLKTMKQQISDILGDGAKVDLDSTGFDPNVRFRPSDVKFYDPLRLAATTDYVTRLKRYTLIPADSDVIVKEWRPRRRKGTKTAPTVHTIKSSGHPGVTYDRIHDALQAELFALLQDRFGKTNVDLEDDFVDIKVNGNKRKIMIEVKSDGDARLALRNALGQILEYAYLSHGFKRADVELVIIAPGIKTPDIAGYITRLQTEFKLPINYCSFSLGDQLPPIFDKTYSTKAS